MRDAFAGLRPLLLVKAHQDRKAIAPWIMLISALSVSSLIGHNLLLNDPATSAALTALVSTNPAFLLLFGPVGDLSTADGFNAWRALAFGDFFAGLMAILIVIRNSRADEDSGQAELVASGVVGRYARLGAAVVLAWLAALALGVVASVATILFGGDVTGSIALAATFTVSALIFAAVAAVTAQIASLASSARAIAIGVLGVAYLTRGVANVLPEIDWAIWLTPLGWLQEVRPVAENRVAPLLAGVGLAVAVFGLALFLQARRDFGQGFIPPSRGPARGRMVATIWGLAVRLQRGSIVGWTIVFVALGVIIGYVSSTLGDLFQGNPVIATFLAATGASEADLAFAFLLMLTRILAIIAAAYGVGVMMSVYGEESQDRVEPLLAGAVSRTTYLASNVLIALIGPAIALVIAGITIGVASAAAGEPGKTGDLALQALASVPAVWSLIGLSVATVGARPRVRMVAWLGIVATFALDIFGPMFNLWDWILGISPLRHVPDVTLQDADYVPLLWLAAISAALIVIGFAGYRRRDVPQ